MISQQFAVRAVALALLAACFASPASPLRAQSQGDSAPLAAEKPDTTHDRVFIPYSKLKDVFGTEGATAIMPYMDLQKLWALLDEYQADRTPRAVITQADYTIAVEKSVARIKASLKLKSLKEGWSSVPLPFGGAAIGKLTSEDKRVLLRGAGNNQYELLLPDKGDYEISLELFGKVASSPDGRTLDFHCPTVGISTVEVTVPEADQTIKLKPSGVELPAAPGEAETKLKASLGSTGQVVVSWAPRASAKPQMELLTSVKNNLKVTLADGLIHTQANLDIDVLRGELSQLQIDVPLGDRILDVSAPEAKVRGWKAEDGPNSQVITVDLLQAVEKSLKLEVHTERMLPDESTPLAGVEEGGAVHGVHVRGAIRESGYVAVTHSSEVQLAVDQQEGLIRVDAADAPKALRSANSVFYRFYSPKFTLVAGIKPVEPRIRVANNTLLAFRPGELFVKSTLDYVIERAGVFELKVKLPENLTVDQVVAPNLREFTIDDATGTLTISFVEKQTGKLQAVVTGRVKLSDEAEETLVLPIPEPLGVFQETGDAQIYAPESLEVITEESETSGAHAEQVDGSRIQEGRLVGRWTWQRRPVVITVRTVRKPTRLTADAAGVLEVHEDQAKLNVRVTYHIEHAPLRTFRIAVPKAFSSKVTFEVPEGLGQPIQNRTAEETEEDDEDGWITWTIETQKDAIGSQTFEVTYELDLTREGDQQSSEFELSLPQVMPSLSGTGEKTEVPVLRTTGELTVEKDRSLSVSAVMEADQFEAIDVRELETLTDRGDVAFRYFSQPAKVTVKSQKYQIQSVVETVISRGLVEVAVGYDPKATFRCRYRLSSSERQRLMVKLPKNAEPLSVLVNGSHVELENAAETDSNENFDAYLVNVARSSDSDEEFTLTLQFQWDINPPQFKGPLGKMQLFLPRIGNSEGNAAVQQMRMVVWVPDRFYLVGTPQPFNASSTACIGEAFLRVPDSSPVNRQELERWIGGVPTGTIEFPDEGRAYSFQTVGDVTSTQVSWWELHYMVWVLSGAVLVIGWLLKSTSWENRLGIVLLVAFAAAIYAVKDTDTVAYAVAAARFGIYAAAAIWVIHGLLGDRFRKAEPATAPATPAVTPPPEEPPPAP